jgi:DNA-binding winged helix-turn-helix (wHTH) protein/Tfp pilus assembly protein PilF
MESKPIYQFGPSGRFHLDTTERVLLADGKAVALAPKLFATLLVLITHRGRIVEKEELLRLIWPDTFVEENSLNKNVWALRRVLGGGDDSPESFIETIPKRGYRFIAEVREVGGGSGTRVLAQRTRASIVIEEEIDDEPVATKIAVLPFRLLGAGDGEHLGVGLADALITRLSNLGLLHVRSTAAIVKYAAAPGNALGPVAAGRELQVDAVLDGSIRRAEERIRVTVQLVSVQNEAPLWAGKFDERFTDIFTVEDSISEQVADALLLKLTSVQRRLLTKRPTESIAAYELYLRGIHQLNKHTAESLRQATVFFNQAIEQDPAYAVAYARLSGCYNLLYVHSSGPPPVKIARLARSTATQALALDDSLAEAHAADAIVKLCCEWRLADALVASQRAAELKPHGVFSNIALGWSLAAHGRLAEGVAALRRAQQSAPQASAINVSLGNLLLLAHWYDEAAEVFQKMLALYPQHPEAFRGLGQANILRGQIAEVRLSLDNKTLPNQQSISPYLRSLASARLGDVADAQQALAEILELARREYIRPVHLAAIYAELGEVDAAFSYLERSFEEREPALVHLKVYPFFDKLRGDPRFAQLLGRIGLSQPSII